MSNLRVFLSLVLASSLVFMGVAFFPTRTRALANITINNAKIISDKTVLVTFNNPGANLASVAAAKWHIDQNDGGVSPLTATAAVITSAGSPWTVTLTFDPHPAWPTDQSYKASNGLYVDAGGVTNLTGDTNVVVADSSSIIIADAQRPVVASSKITAAHTATIVYSEQVTTVAGDYTNMAVGGISRSVTGLSGSGGSEVTLTFNGASAAVDATGSVKIDNVADLATVPNTITGISSQTLTDGQIPTLVSVNEFDVNHDGAIDEMVLGFDEAIADSSVVAAYFIVSASVPADTVMAANSTNGLDTNTANDATITIKVAAGVAGTEAKNLVHLINSVTDTAGNSVANGTFFAASVTDQAASVVASKTPANGATSVPATSDVVVTFSEPMDAGSLELTLPVTPTPSYTATWSGDSKTVTLSNVSLESKAGYGYPITITAVNANDGVKPLYGLPYTWSFVVDGGRNVSLASTGGGSGGSTFMPSLAASTSVPEVASPPPSTPVAAVPPAATPANPSPDVAPTSPLPPAQTPAPVPTGSPVSLPTQVYRSFERYMLYGSQGLEVRLLQALLKQLGFFHFPRATGYFGPYTRAAVRSFQASRGIEQTGTVGPKTRAALNMLP